MERIGADFGARCSVLSYLLDRLRGYPGIHSAKAEVEGRLLCKFRGGSFRWPGCRCNHHTNRRYQNTAADAPFWRGNLALEPESLPSKYLIYSPTVPDECFCNHAKGMDRRRGLGLFQRHDASFGQSGPGLCDYDFEL